MPWWRLPCLAKMEPLLSQQLDDLLGLTRYAGTCTSCRSRVSDPITGLQNERYEAEMPYHWPTQRDPAAIVMPSYLLFASDCHSQAGEKAMGFFGHKSGFPVPETQLLLVTAIFSTTNSPVSQSHSRSAHHTNRIEPWWSEVNLHCALSSTAKLHTTSGAEG